MEKTKESYKEMEALPMEEIDLKYIVPFKTASDFEEGKYFSFKVVSITKVKTSFGDKVVLILQNSINEFEQFELSSWNYKIIKPISLKIGDNVKLLNDGTKKLVLDLA
jgi:hypothetical protein